MSTLRRRSQRRTMVGSDGGDQGGSVSAGAVVLILDRLHRDLRVYRRSKSGKYDWGDWHSAATAQVEAELLREHPEWWRRYVRQAQTSKHSWRVFQLLVADLVEESWPDLIIDPVQEPPRPGEKFRFSPLFGWILAVATGQIGPPTKGGYDPAERVWRNLAIYFAVRDLKAVGLDEGFAREFVAEEVGLTKTRVGQICLKHEKVHRRVHRKK